jgi:hypothetical protein
MTIWDDRILEFIREHDGATVGRLTDSDVIHVSNAHISNRCMKLAEKGFLQSLAISDTGYLIFVTRPISLALALLTVAGLLLPLLNNWRESKGGAGQ